MKRLIKTFEHDAWGTAEFILEGKGGENVTLAIGECLKDGRLDNNPGGARVYWENQITLKSGIHRYSFVIPRHRQPKGLPPGLQSPLNEEITPFRYAEVSGDCNIHDIIRHEVMPENFNDDDSDFTSSNTILNQVWDLCKYTMKATAAFGIFIDGERERYPYEGDAYINQLGWFCCSASQAIPKRTIERLLEYPTWPFEWSLLMPVIVKDYLLYSGDEKASRTFCHFLKNVF